MRIKSCVLLPAAGRKTQPFILIFSEPGPRGLANPCRSFDMSQNSQHDKGQLKDVPEMSIESHPRWLRRGRSSRLSRMREKRLVIAVHRRSRHSKMSRSCSRLRYARGCVENMVMSCHYVSLHLGRERGGNSCNNTYG